MRFVVHNWSMRRQWVPGLFSTRKRPGDEAKASLSSVENVVTFCDLLSICIFLARHYSVNLICSDIVISILHNKCALRVRTLVLHYCILLIMAKAGNLAGLRGKCYCTVTASYSSHRK